MRTSLKTRDSLLAVSLVLFGLAPVVRAQAWLPPAGSGNVTFTYQNSLARGHLTPTGQLAAGAAGQDPVRAHVFAMDTEYGVTDRFALHLSIPFVRARYGGSSPHRIGVHGQATTVDDGHYHGAFQDFRFGGRFNVVARPLTITPFVEGILPSHHYESRAHSAIGRDLRALVIGANFAAFLDSMRPGLYVNGQISYAIVQKVAGIRPNRTRMDGEVGYFVNPRLAVRFLESLTLTHDGLDFPYGGLPLELSLNHDRLSRDNLLNIGGGIVIAINESVQLFLNAGTLAWGQNIHPHRGASIGINWHYSTR